MVSTFARFSEGTASDILRSFDVTHEGLRAEEVTRRRALYGPNVLPVSQVQWWHILRRQFRSPFLAILVVAGILSFIFGEKIDGWLILAFVIINTTIGFYQEYHSEQTLRLLRSLVKPQARVRRNGVVALIPTDELVPGDLLILEPGDVLAGDVRLIEADQCTVDESALTGESVQVVKQSDAMAVPPKEPYQAVNITFSSTTITSGSGTGVVIATAGTTVIGEVRKVGKV